MRAACLPPFPSNSLRCRLRGGLGFLLVQFTMPFLYGRRNITPRRVPSAMHVHSRSAPAAMPARSKKCKTKQPEHDKQEKQRDQTTKKPKAKRAMKPIGCIKGRDRERLSTSRRRDHTAPRRRHSLHHACIVRRPSHSCNHSHQEQECHKANQNSCATHMHSSVIESDPMMQQYCEEILKVSGRKIK